MAKIRIGFSTHFEVENELVGIGTDNPTNTKQVLGNIHASNAKAVGISTLGTYQGFLDKEARFGKSVIDINSQAGTLGEIVIDGDVTVSSGSTLCSGVDELSLTDSFSVPTGNTDSRIHCHTAGSMRFNEDFGTLEFYTGDEWRTVNSFKDTGNRGRGIIMGGSGNISTIQFVQISTLGDARNFGDLTQTVGYINGNNVSSSTRGLRQGGYTPSKTDTVDYITMASEGDAIDFGNLTSAREGGSGCASETRGIAAGGSTGSHVDTIDYVEIATIGNYLDFGNLTSTNYNGPDAVSNGIRGIFAGGIKPGFAGGASSIDTITIASKGNAINFGDLTNARRNIIPCSNSIRGVFMGGRDNSGSVGGVIDYITMASEGNATHFGNLTNDQFRGAGTNNHVRGLAIGGDTNSPGSNTNVIESLIIATTGSVEDFGDSAVETEGQVGCSDSHGGLGGF